MFTINNYTEDDVKKIAAWDVDLCGYGKEVGESKTPHLQGFVVSRIRRNLASMKSVLHPTAHWTQMRGTIEQNIEYCKKDGEYTQFGELPQKVSKKRPLEEVVDTMKTATSFHQVVVAHPVEAIKHYGNMAKVFNHLKRPSYDYVKPSIQVLHGETGTGKTRMAFEAAKTLGLEVFKKDASMEKWWDGYCSEDYIILDDFRGSSMPLSQLLVLLDGYGSYQQIKGAYVWVKPRYWCITSNKHPSEWYRSEIDVTPLMRRIDDIKLV